MKLRKPEQYKPDMGRSLSEEERRQIEGGHTAPSDQEPVLLQRGY